MGEDEKEGLCVLEKRERRNDKNAAIREKLP